MNIDIICQRLFFFSAPFYLITQIVQTVQGARVLLFYLFIYLVGIGFAGLENWQQVWKVANQFTVLSAS